MKEITKGELYVIRDALQEKEGDDVRDALAIVEGLLYDAEEELDFE